MRNLCVQLSFAATLASAIVLLAVACWNEGCNQSVAPQNVAYCGKDVPPRDKQDPEIMSVGSGTGSPTRPALLIVPPSLSPEQKP